MAPNISRVCPRHQRRSARDMFPRLRVDFFLLFAWPMPPHYNNAIIFGWFHKVSCIRKIKHPIAPNNKHNHKPHDGTASSHKANKNPITPYEYIQCIFERIGFLFYFIFSSRYHWERETTLFCCIRLYTSLFYKIEYNFFLFSCFSFHEYRRCVWCIEFLIFFFFKARKGFFVAVHTPWC